MVDQVLIKICLVSHFMSNNCFIFQAFVLLTLTAMAVADHAPHHAPLHPPKGLIPHVPIHPPKQVLPPVHHPAPLHHPVPIHHAPVHHAPVHHAPVHHAPVHHAPVHHAPVHHAPVHHAPAPYHPPKHEPHYESHPAHYNYAYAVKDDYAGLHFGQEEHRDGYATNGQYHVLLPDGRTQTVNYNVADDYSGYVADVKYSGEAHYDHHAPVHHKPAYHKPAPAYHKPA